MSGLGDERPWGNPRFVVRTAPRCAGTSVWISWKPILWWKPSECLSIDLPPWQSSNTWQMQIFRMRIDNRQFVHHRLVSFKIIQTESRTDTIKFLWFFEQDKCHHFRKRKKYGPRLSYPFWSVFIALFCVTPSATPTLWKQINNKCSWNSIYRMFFFITMRLDGRQNWERQSKVIGLSCVAGVNWKSFFTSKNGYFSAARW